MGRGYPADRIGGPLQMQIPPPPPNENLPPNVPPTGQTLYPWVSVTEAPVTPPTQSEWTGSTENIPTTITCP
jgi:hypothetical protein